MLQEALLKSTCENTEQFPANSSAGSTCSGQARGSPGRLGRLPRHPCCPHTAIPLQDTAPHPSPQQRPQRVGSSRPSLFSPARWQVPPHHLGPALSPPPVPAGPTPPLPATAPHTSTRCTTETLPNPRNSLFSTSSFFFFVRVCAGDGGTKPHVTGAAHLGRAGTGHCGKRRPPGSPTWQGQTHHAWSRHPARMGTGRQWHEPLSPLSPCPCTARNTVGNGLTLTSLLAQASPEAPGPEPRATSCQGKGNLEMPPSGVPSAVGTSSPSETAPGKQPCPQVKGRTLPLPFLNLIRFLCTQLPSLSTHAPPPHLPTPPHDTLTPPCTPPRSARSPRPTSPTPAHRPRVFPARTPAAR